VMKRRAARLTHRTLDHMCVQLISNIVCHWNTDLSRDDVPDCNARTSAATAMCSQCWPARPQLLRTIQHPCRKIPRPEISDIEAV